MKDPYEVLGVSPSDSDETIRAAYKALVKKYHPDNFSDSPLNGAADAAATQANLSGTAAWTTSM